MLRFLGVRILQAIPVLIVMSIITFVIIQAPPGDYGDFIRTNMIVQGNATRRGGQPPPPKPTARRTA